MNKEQILKRIARTIELEEEYDEICRELDCIVGMQWTLPAELAKQDWARAHIDTSGHDAIRGGLNIFDTQTLKWDVQPITPTDADRAERLEFFLEWQFSRVNALGQPLRKSLQNSLMYDRCIAQVEYLPYWGGKPKNGNYFCVTMHKNAYFGMGKYGLDWIAAVEVMTAFDIINHWRAYENETDSGKKIKSVLAALEEDALEDSETEYIFIDYTDKKKRLVCFYPSESGDLDDVIEEMSEDVVVLMDEPNDLGFISWAVGEGRKDPLLAPLAISKLWSNYNMLESFIQSGVFKNTYLPVAIETTMTGEPHDIPTDGSVPTVTLRPGENYQPISPAPIDPRMRELADRYRNFIQSVTSLQALSNYDIKGNLQFATLNAQVQLALSMLEPPRKNVEVMWAEVGRLMFQWIDYTGDTVSAYFKGTKGTGVNKANGYEFALSKEDFELDKIFISCELTPNTPTDRLQRMQYIAQIKQTFPTSVPEAELIETLKIGNPQALREEREREIIRETALQVFQARAQAEVQKEMSQFQAELQAQMQQQQQQAMMEAQMQQQQAQQPQPFPQGDGASNQSGGMPAAMSNPEMSRTQMEGQDVTGQGMAGMA